MSERKPITDKERWQAAWEAGFKKGHERVEALEEELRLEEAMNQGNAKRADEALDQARQLAKDVLSLAEDAGMPDSYKETDSRMQRARAMLRAGAAE